jgi:hypothetical protein
MDDLTPRLRAVCDLDLAELRESCGRHEYDGKIQDKSRAGMRAGLARLTGPAGDPLADPHDEAHLAAFEQRARVMYDRLELHRSNPMFHFTELDLTPYDRDYGPAAERDRARREHLGRWPQAVDGALDALDQVSAPVAKALTAAARGLAAAVPIAVAGGASEQVAADALSAHARLVAHLDQAAQAAGGPGVALGADGLAALMGSGDAMPVDLGRLSEEADAERDRLRERLAESCAQLDPGRPASEVVLDLNRDHPDARGVVETARLWTQRAIDFTIERDLAPYNDGECLVGPAPESRRWGMAMMAWAAPGEPEGPSWYYIAPPDESWTFEEQEQWLEVFSATSLPGITVHEVAPGHFSHGRALRRAPTPVRRLLMSTAFIEGWAHYVEEVCVDEGFCAEDPRFAIGVWLGALIRVTRLACAIGVHTAGMTVEEGARRFEQDAALAGPAALSEASRATFDPTYGRYTWGKLEILRLREQARAAWGAGFSLPRFHKAMLDLGSPPLGLLRTAVERG